MLPPLVCCVRLGTQSRSCCTRRARLQSKQCTSIAIQLPSNACCNLVSLWHSCALAVLCIRHAAPDQAAYNHEVLWSRSGTGHIPHCLPRGEFPPTGPHHSHEHLLQVCCRRFPRSNRSWDFAAISAVVKPNVADHLHWMLTLVHCSSCTHALSFKHAFQPIVCGPPCFRLHSFPWSSWAEGLFASIIPVYAGKPVCV